MTSISISECSSERYPSSISSSLSSPPSSFGSDDDHKSITNPEPTLKLSITSPQDLPISLNLNSAAEDQSKFDHQPISPTSSNQITLRHSPSMSVIQSKSTQINRTRANSLTTHCTLAERRRSKTSAYLTTEDFKKNFASKLNSVKERERTQSVEPNVNWLTKSNVWNFDRIEENSSNSLSSLSLTDPDFSLIKICGLAPSAIPPRGNKLHEMINHLLSLPTDELSAQLEMHFNRLEPGRDAEELEARNEVISTLADQLANQLEINDKLLFDLASLRSTHALLTSELVDLKDEMACLLSRMNGRNVENVELSKVKLQSEDQIKDLRKALEESKKAFNQLKLEQQSIDRRRSLQSYQSTLNLISSNSHLMIGPKRSGSLLLSKELIKNDVNHKRLSLTDHGNQFNHFLRPGFLFSNPTKPVRPPRSPARSNTPSPVLSEESSSSGSSDKEELELLRLQCTQLRIELNESEDSRLASQAALDALKTFISSNGTHEVSAVKLPPLPTEIESPISNKPRWGNLLTRSFVTPPSPNSTFTGFGLWGKRSKENEEITNPNLTNLPITFSSFR
ncbi:hypothetical protein DFH28DRAFT_1124587 [Melampsora americana]|nr:hypothetical protein DFH28DRAFT_1124587 [Melampsora americana]